MPSKRTTRRRRDLLILLTVLPLVVCCIGGIAGISRFYHRASTAPAELTAAASKYLDAVQGGDLDEAYRLLCSEVHAQVTPETFRAHTKKIIGYKILVRQPWC